MNKGLIFWCLFFWCPLISHAEDGFDTRFQGLDSWVEDAELSLKSGDFGDLQDQQLSFDVKIKNSEQLKAEQSILRMGREKASINTALYRGKQLKQRYLDRVGFLDQELRARLLQKERNIRQSELHMWKASFTAGGFKPEKLQQADVSLDAVWADELKNRAGLKQYTELTGVVSANPGVKSIQQVVQSINQIIDSRSYEGMNPVLRKAQLSLELAEKEQQRIAAKEALSLNSIKLQYDNKDRTFGGSLGVKIPITKNSFETLQKKQDIHYSQLQLNNTQTEIFDSLKAIQFQVLSLQEEWRSNLAMLNRLNKRMYRIRQTENLQLILDLKLKQLAYQKRQKQLWVQSLQEYIGFLYQAGLLSSYPERDWLRS